MKKRNKILMIGLLSTALSMNMVGVGSTKISINRKTYQEGNTNLVLNKILSDNELKQEIPHMFNYASTGNYYDGTNDPNFVTEGLYSNVDEDGTTYYYRGNVKNNNLQFGAYDEDYYVYQGKKAQYYQSQESCEEAGNSDCSAVKLASAGDKMYWKIIRVNGDGSLRLMYTGPGMKLSIVVGPSSFNEEEISGVIGATPYNLNDDDPKYTGYTYDNGTDSFVKREIDTWYNNTLGKNSAYDSMVILGRFCSDSSGYHYNETFGVNSFSSVDRLVQASSDFAKDNAPTFACPSTSESYGGSYRLKAGLITADELAYAGESYLVDGNSYLNPGQYGTLYLTMTPSDSNEYGSSSNWRIGGEVSVLILVEASGLRPVINIKTDGMTLIGDGTLDNPYTLQVAEQVEEPEESGSVENNNQENSFKNPETRSMIAIGVTIGLIIVLGTGAFVIYRKKSKEKI